MQNLIYVEINDQDVIMMARKIKKKYPKLKPSKF